MIRLVCFDLGGVVVRIRRGLEECCRAAGVPVREVRRRPDEEQALERAYCTGRLSVRAYVERLSALLGGVYSPDELLAAHPAVLVDEYPGVLALVRRLHAAGLRTAALSNTCAGHWDQLALWPAVAALGERFASHLIGEVKPDLEAYRHVERALGVAPDEILFFEDTAANAEAAVRAGWSAAVVDPFQPTAPQLERELVRRGLLVAPLA